MNGIERQRLWSVRLYKAAIVVILFALGLSAIWVIPALIAWNPNHDYAGLLPIILMICYGPGIVMLTVAVAIRGRRKPEYLRLAVALVVAIWTTLSTTYVLKGMT